ncbi:MAG: hypothetical protein JWM02_1428 [Frankiales bacterium]|nr:hypothetical protein [Frankiales bacterium]
MVELADNAFEAIYEALRLANSPYTQDEVAHVVAMEAKAWDVAQRVRRTHIDARHSPVTAQDEPG